MCDRRESGYGMTATLHAVSTESFKGMPDEQIAAEAKRMMAVKGKVPDSRRTKESVEEQLKRIGQTLAGNLADNTEHSRRMRDAGLKAAQERAAARWTDAHVPERQAKRKTFERGTPKGEAWQAALKSIRALPKDAHVALIGQNGSGKTQLAVELIREATTRGETALWTSAMKFLMDVKKCYRDETKTTEEEIIARYVKPSLLVLDEFHRRKGNEWEDGLLFQVIDDRYNALKRTVLIANQTAEQFDQQNDSSIISRMRETGGVLECNWGSFR